MQMEITEVRIDTVLGCDATEPHGDHLPLEDYHQRLAELLMSGWKLHGQSTIVRDDNGFTYFYQMVTFMKAQPTAVQPAIVRGH